MSATIQLHDRVRVPSFAIEAGVVVGLSRDMPSRQNANVMDEASNRVVACVPVSMLERLP